jgi:salicylate hydroxylase
MSTEAVTKALCDLPLPHWWDPKTSQNRSALIYASKGSPRFVTAYFICNGAYFNISCIIKIKELEEWSTESWNIDSDRVRMVEEFGNINETLKRILRWLENLVK